MDTTHIDKPTGEQVEHIQLLATWLGLDLAAIRQKRIRTADDATRCIEELDEQFFARMTDYFMREADSHGETLLQRIRYWLLLRADRQHFRDHAGDDPIIPRLIELERRELHRLEEQS